MNPFINIALLLFFWVGALFHGYLYEMDYLYADIFLFICLAAVVFRQKEIKLRAEHFLLFIFIGLYIISLFYSVDKEKALLEALRVIGLIPLSFLVSIQTTAGHQVILRSIPWIGIFLVAVGLIFELERQGRLESTLQYANALAIFLLLAVLLSILFYILERKRSQLILLLINAIGLWLTFSRSVWVLWALLIVCCIIAFKQMREKTVLVSIISMHALSLVVSAMIKQDLSAFWNRARNIHTQASEYQLRTVYWQDSLMMIKDHLWSGTGGGGWSVLLPYYRSEPYFVRFVHNHYLQVGLDVGVVGIIILVALIILFYKQAGQTLHTTMDPEKVLWTKGLLIGNTVLLLHSGFDFDYSFLLLFGLFLFFSGIVSSEGLALSIQLSRIRIPIVILGVLPVVLCILWIAIGQFYKNQGQAQVEQGEWVKALNSFAQSAKWIPWAASAHYESAKLYILFGNATQDRKHYENAKTEISQSVQMVPREQLYQSLLTEIQKIK
ncbi:O-antigen ligase family protein [Paenibacillus radicis (ex Xue et al. 2023)]|uniref:O-antigen ligase family protein n=1 Tax=Paenibacillus radicis (ex Xue et al. 2023) TaxID=2972489 RepID=A0ABT1YUD9_9BACL|nr:O-antigen ligase family protein [Paenibacillus radicis (ex Xue et al. 2023)]MCR8636440.1 O-antigen ligase family protein [Paenibacillus radicis (ex Xue et al. 2023)]